MLEGALLQVFATPLYSSVAAVDVGDTYPPKAKPAVWVPAPAALNLETFVLPVEVHVPVVYSSVFKPPGYPAKANAAV